MIAFLKYIIIVFSLFPLILIKGRINYLDKLLSGSVYYEEMGKLYAETTGKKSPYP